MKKRIPIDLFDRMSMKNRNVLTPKYHKLCVKNYDWWVIDYENKDNYYTKGDMPELKKGICIYDCNWKPEHFNKVPYKQYISNVSGNVVKYYARFGLPSLEDYGYGYSREDSVVTEDDIPIFLYMNSAIQDSTSYYYAWWDLKLNHISMVVNGSCAKWINGECREGVSTINTNKVNSVNTEIALYIAKKLNSKKFNNCYKPFIDKLIELYKLNKTQI